MEKISLVCSSYNPKMDWLFEMLDSVKGFDEVLLYCRGSQDRFLDGDYYDDKFIAGETQGNDFSERRKQIEQYIDTNKDKCIRLLTDKVKRTGATAYNYIINQSKGDWIIPVSDHDTFHTKTLLKCIRRIKNNDYKDADIVHSQCTVNGNGRWGSNNVTLSGLQSSNQLPFTSFYRRAVFDELGGYVDEGVIDWGFWIRASMLGLKFVYFNEPIYNYRYISQSTLANFKKKQGGIGTIRTKILENCNDFIRSRQVH